MGESVCLVRSFSQPADISSRGTNEAVPHPVLTESVSFGRFASESLAWEKWSAFTQNRYLEEVERFTKPGSVAQKKAFFEAHFRNRAAGRATKTNIEQVNVKTSDEIVCEIPEAPKAPLLVNNGMAMNEEVDSAVPSISVMNKATDVQVKLTTSVENVNSMAVPEGDALDEGNPTYLSKKRRHSSSGLKTFSRSSKLEPSFVIGLDLSLKKTRKGPSSSSSKRSISLSKNQNRSPPESFHMSITCAPSGNTDKTIVRIPQNRSRSSTNAKGDEKADKKKRSGPSSRHMSANFAPSARQTAKTAPKNLSRNSTTQETSSSKARNCDLPKGNDASKTLKRPLPRTAKDCSNAAKCSTSAFSFRSPGLLPPPNSRPSEDKRKNITIGSSVSCSIPNNVQRQPSASCGNLSTHNRAKAKSLTVSSPFNFRSDERAEKRKEFFKKVEANNKKEDGVKEQLSYGIKTNQNTYFASEKHKNPQVGGCQVPLISLNSPRLYRNRTPGTEKIRKSPQKVTSTKSRSSTVSEKHKACKNHPSRRWQTKKKTQENLSPNIVQK